MLEVKVTLVPQGNRDLQRDLYTMKVFNIGTGNLLFGDYHGSLVNNEDNELLISGVIIRGFDRTRGALELSKRFLEEIIKALGNELRDHSVRVVAEEVQHVLGKGGAEPR